MKIQEFLDRFGVENWFDSVETVEILWSEHPNLDGLETRLLSFGDAEKRIKRALYSIPHDERGYRKTKFVLRFYDGFEYIGRLDLAHDDDTSIRAKFESMVYYERNRCA